MIANHLKAIRLERGLVELVAVVAVELGGSVGLPNYALERTFAARKSLNAALGPTGLSVIVQ